MSHSKPISPPTLIIPMDLETLCVGLPDTKLPMLGPTYDFRLLPGPSQPEGIRRPNLTEALIAGGRPFAQGNAALMGVHLHWTLPEALRHAQHGASESAHNKQGGGFPLTPNRWLVTRLLMEENGTIASRRWVVESDRLNDTPPLGLGLSHPSVPIDLGKTTQRHQYIGQRFPGDSWQESRGAKRYAPLTALGYGDPSFASFYPNCASVFGFHDDMKDVPAGQCTLAYHVVGWYGGGVEDPLSTEAGQRLIERFCSWQPTADSPGKPNRMLCNSALHEVEWNSQAQYCAPSGKQALTCSIGASAAEALSAMVATIAETPELEEGLNALQFGLVGNEDGQPDAVDLFVNQIHEAAFTSSSGGSLWIIRKPERTSDSKQSVPALPDWSLKWLDALSTHQQALDRRHGQLTRDRRQLYSDWHKYQLSRYGMQGHVNGETLFALLREQSANILREARRIERREKRLERVAQRISKLLPPGYRFETEAAPRFWRAQDPSLMLLSRDLESRSLSTPFDYVEGGKLPCRLNDQVVRGVSLSLGEKPLTLENDQWLRLAATPGLPDELAIALNALAAEAVLFSHTAKPLVGRCLAEEQVDTQVSVAQITQQFAEQAQAFLNGHVEASASFQARLAPTPPRFARESWAPWLPNQFQYEVKVTPSYAGHLGSHTLLDHVEWKENDLYLYGDPTQEHSPGLYSGTAMLAHHGTVQLVNAAQALLDRQADTPELKALLDWVNDLPIATQAMSEFGAALLMTKPSGQLPVYDPYVDETRSKEVEQIAKAVDRENWFAPLHDNLMNPLRTGEMALQRLRIVDRFGRFQEYSAAQADQLEILIAQRLRSQQAGEAPSTAFLPARITQPARLQFRWLSATSQKLQSNAHPSSSPIMGWVLLDNVDGGVSFFDTDGEALGTLRCSAGADARVLWQSAPPNVTFTEDLQDSLQSAHPELRAFALTLFTSGVEGVRRFRVRTKSALHKIQPDSASADDALALLLGRPLALVRATLALELKGGPAIDHSWEALRRRAGGPAANTGEGICAVKFPVSLGASGRIKDGLVTYWPIVDGTTDFKAPRAASREMNMGATGKQDHLLIQAEAEQPLAVTMLIDPRAMVHATTGILPVKAITLPAAHYNNALGRMKVALRTGPLLKSVGAPPSLPVPSAAHGRWVWYAADRTSHQLTPESDKTDQLQLGRQEIVDGWIKLEE